MEIIETIDKTRKIIAKAKSAGKKIGFVPTMGALHAGHLSLVDRARRDNDVVVVSIFVNPLQFGPREDFHKYPRTVKNDFALLRGHCDMVFAPASREMFPDDYSTRVEVKGPDDVLCARSRPGHFAGVATVVAKLFGIVSPDRAYFGQKDAQQAVIIRKMVRDLNFPVEVVMCPTIRESDGLAMSSRNAYLSGRQRGEAVVLFQGLKSAERMVAAGQKDALKIRRALLDLLRRTPSARVDYVEIVDKHSLRPVRSIAKEALLCMAVWIGKTRLIDNIELKIM
jgi:pantoate--beta-alanine ligase